MINVQASTVINRPIEQVFAFVADLENNPKWEKNFVSVKRLSPGNLGVGATYLCTLQVPGQRAESHFEITEYKPNRKIAFRGDLPAQAKPIGSITFESVDGGTRVTTLPRPEMGGIFKLLEPLMAGFIKKQNEEHLQNLKRLLEA